mmetsp:Transcript_85300/g.254278  ORF Transcript_85300/g.254278 Transcript_85300/m.254278 type:complete len:89 (+) Transcript_85300:251-517(+)
MILCRSPISLVARASPAGAFAGGCGPPGLATGSSGLDAGESCELPLATWGLLGERRCGTSAQGGGGGLLTSRLAISSLPDSMGSDWPA